MRRYPQLVTFQEATEVRLPSGAVTFTYANADGLADLPARVIPVVEEERTEQAVVTEDLHQIIVQGDRDVRPEMAAVTVDGVFDVMRVSRPTIRRQPTMATLVIAQRIAP